MTKPYSQSVFWNGIIAIGLDVYVRNWNDSKIGPEQVKLFIINGTCAKHILNMLHNYFVSRKKIISVEDMPVELLSDLESEALEWSPGITGKELTRLMKSIWAMNYLITADTHEGSEFPVLSD